MSVILGAISAAVIGTFWYGTKTPMGKWHMQYLGFDKLSQEEKDKLIAEAKPKMWKTYSLQLLLSFITASFIGFVTGFTVENGGPAISAYYYVSMIWFAFAVPLIGQEILWGTTEGSLSWKRMVSGSLYNLLTFLVMTFIAVQFFN